MRAPAALGLAYLMVMTAVVAGIRAPERGWLAPLPASVTVDYSPLRLGLPPLRLEFIREVLGETGGVSPRRSEPKSRNDEGPDIRTPLTRIVDEHPSTNDRVGDARAIPRPPFTARTNTANATRSSEDPSECGSVGGTVWYRYRSTILDGVVANTFGTSRSIALGVFVGSPGRLSGIGCDTDIEGNAVVAFTAQPGRDYYFQVATPAGGGPIVFNLELQGTTTLESVSPAGEPGDDLSAGASLSGDGRVVVFGSLAKNIVPGIPEDPCIGHEPYVNSSNNVAHKITNGANSCFQLFARDRVTGKTVLVTASPEGHAGNAHTSRGSQWSDDRTQNGGASVSFNGRYVAFSTEATNLVADDRNTISDAFVRDLWTGTTEIASLDNQGRQVMGAIGSAIWPSISDDGRFVVFTSTHSGFVPGDTNNASDVFLRDRLLKTTTRVSVSSTGEQSEPFADLLSLDNQAPMNSFPMTPCLSGDGRYIAFRSASSNLVPGDTNRMADIFVHDRITRRTERVSVGPQGREADLYSQTWPGCLSRDGRFVVFTSRATNLVEGDTNGLVDVFVRDRLLKVTRRVNVSSAGRQSESGDLTFKARVAVISANGRYVAFHSAASDLVDGDQNRFSDIFVHDLQTGTTTRVNSKPGGGEFTDSDAYGPAISADGRSIAFDAAPSGAYLRPTDFLAPAQVYVHERSRSEP